MTWGKGIWKQKRCCLPFHLWERGRETGTEKGIDTRMWRVTSRGKQTEHSSYVRGKQTEHSS